LFCLRFNACVDDCCFHGVIVSHSQHRYKMFFPFTSNGSLRRIATPERFVTPRLSLAHIPSIKTFLFLKKWFKGHPRPWGKINEGINEEGGKEKAAIIGEADWVKDDRLIEKVDRTKRQKRRGKRRSRIVLLSWRGRKTQIELRATRTFRIDYCCHWFLACT